MTQVMFWSKWLEKQLDTEKYTKSLEIRAKSLKCVVKSAKQDSKKLQVDSRLNI